MNNNNIISESSENYLEVIYELGIDKNAVRLTDVATRMKVSKASVNKAVGVLKQAGLVDQQLYGSMELTPQGEMQAKEVMQRHSQIRRFFCEILKVNYEDSDKDACRVEHVVGEKVMTAWSDYINNILEKN